LRNPESQAPVHEPDYPLPRPGNGEPVNIPGLPSDIKGVDVTNRNARMPNYELDLSCGEFESKLREQGWTERPSDDGK
jgi:hypothetical protein